MAGKTEKNNSQSDICTKVDNNTDNGDDDEVAPDYDWSQAARGDLLGCYYYGYVCTQILGAWLSSRYGFKIILFINTLVASVLTIVMCKLFTHIMVETLVEFSTGAYKIH